MHRWYVAAVVLGVVATFGLVVYMWWRYQQGTASKEDGGDELAMQLMDNPLQAHQKRSPRGSLSDRAAERQNNAYLVVRVLYQPARILVGYIQVIFITLLRCMCCRLSQSFSTPLCMYNMICIVLL